MHTQTSLCVCMHFCLHVQVHAHLGMPFDIHTQRSEGDGGRGTKHLAKAADSMPESRSIVCTIQIRCSARQGLALQVLLHGRALLLDALWFWPVMEFSSAVAVPVEGNGEQNLNRQRVVSLWKPALHLHQSPLRSFGWFCSKSNCQSRAKANKQTNKTI